MSTGHVSRVENGHVLPSSEFVARYVAMGGDAGRLYSLLDSARRGGRRGTDLPAGDLSDPGADPRLLRRGYAVELIDDGYLIGPGRQPVRNEHRVVIRPLDGQARYFPFRHACEEDPREGVSVISPGPGCKMPVLEEGPSGTIYAVIDFAEAPQDPSGARELSWTITLRTQVPARPQLVGGAMVPVPRARTSVRFTEPALPGRVWWWRDFDTNAGTMRPRPERILSPDATLTYRCEFDGIDAEWWGLSWLWP